MPFLHTAQQMQSLSLEGQNEWPQIALLTLHNFVNMFLTMTFAALVTPLDCGAARAERRSSCGIVLQFVLAKDCNIPTSAEVGSDKCLCTKLHTAQPPQEH